MHAPEHRTDDNNERATGPRLATVALSLAAAWILTLAWIGTNKIAPGTPPASPYTAARDVIAPSTPDSTAVAARPVTSRQLARLPRATTFTTLDAAPRDPHPHTAPDGLVAHPKRALPLYDRPGGRAFAAIPPRQLGVATWLPVTEQRRGWIRILLPARPNRATGWLPRTSRDLQLARSPNRIVVDRARYRLTLYRHHRPVGRWTVGIGKPSAPTPRGRTFILAALREPNPTFSDVIVPLGAHSDTHQTYGGGPGTVGIHTWPTSNVYGRASSDGCIRVPRDALTDISTTVPLGTPVLIR